MRRWLKPANRDLSEQLQVARTIALSLRELPMTSEPLGEAEAAPYAMNQRGLFEMVEFQRIYEWAKQLSGDTREVLISALQRARVLGAQRRVVTAPAMDKLQEIARDFPNFAHVIDYLLRRVALCNMSPTAAFRWPPLLLTGPPGTGKTAFCRRLAGVMDVPFTAIDISTLDTAFKITGLDAGYSTGRPGLVWDALQHECMSPLILLDEIDKQPQGTRDTGLGFLLGLLEPSSAKHFMDAALRLPLNASHILWMATCNDLTQLDEPLLTRFKTFEIAAPTAEQMTAIVQSIHRDMRANEDWAQGFCEGLSVDVIAALQGRTPREIRRALEDAHAQAAMSGRDALRPEDIPLAESCTKRQRMGFLG